MGVIAARETIPRSRRAKTDSETTQLSVAIFALVRWAPRADQEEWARQAGRDGATCRLSLLAAGLLDDCIGEHGREYGCHTDAIDETAICVKSISYKND
jgi:hypothetical protein